MIQFIIKNFNDNENALKLKNKIQSQINLNHRIDCCVDIIDDGSDNPLPESIKLGVNIGELRLYSILWKYLNLSCKYFMLIDSDDDVKPDFVNTVVDRSFKLENNHLDAWALVFNYDTYKNGEYVCTSAGVNSISFNLFEINTFIKLTLSLGFHVDEFENKLGYDKITLNSDTYLWDYLSIESAINSKGFFIASSASPGIYNVSTTPDQHKYIDRERFISNEYYNIYDNPDVKNRLKLWRNIIINRS